MSVIKVKIRDSAGSNTLVERQANVDWETFSMSEIVSNSPDSCAFLLKKYGTKTYEPLVGEEIIVEVDGTPKFGGYVVELEKTGTGLAQKVKVKCKDYTHALDRLLVSKTYTSMNASAIISDIFTNYASGLGFTQSGVVASVLVQKIVFNYLTVSQCLTKLAQMLGSYDWNVDANKDIKFFDTTTVPAPYSITDTGGNFDYNSLVIRKSNTQLRNKIIIRGGITEGDAFTDYKTADGVQKTFFIGYSLTNVYVGLSIGTTIGSGFNALTVGVDGKDIETSFDVMYNSDNGFVRFKDTNIPAVNKIIKYSGNPRFPLVSSKSDLDSINKYGTYEYVIVDKSIKAKLSASQRATAELLKYARPQAHISFSTLQSGLVTGQRILVNSTNYGIINEYYKITNIVTEMKTPDTFRYKVDLALADDIGLVDLLKKILLDGQSDKIDISENEIVDRLYSAPETITLAEAYTFLKSHNLTNELFTGVETNTPQALNYPTKFVAGAYVPDRPDLQTVIANSWYNNNWTRRQKITIDYTKVSQAFTNFPVMVDLSGFGNEFWNYVNTTGSDLRATTSDGITECAIKVAFIDTVNKKGVVWFKAPSLSNTVNTVFYLYHRNVLATAYLDTDTYGANNVSSLFIPQNSFMDDLPATNVAQTTGTTNWINGTSGGSSTITPYGWRCGNSGSWAVLFDTSNPNIGRASLKLSTTGASSYLEVRSNNGTAYYSNVNQFALLPNTQYRMTYRMKTNYVSGDATGAYCNLLMSNSAGTSATNPSAQGSAVKTTTGWTTYTINFTTSADCAWGHLELRIYGHNSGTANLVMDAWFDDIIVDLLPNATTLGNNVYSPSTYYTTTTEYYDIKRPFILDGSPLG